MKVAIVEDQPMYREKLVEVVQGKLGMEIVGEAADGEAALELVRRSNPGLLILDLLLPKLSGLEVAHQLAESHPRLSILGISSDIDTKTLYETRQLGFAGLIDKFDLSTPNLLEALAHLRSGKAYYSQRVLEKLAKMRADPKAFPKILTQREQEVLSLIASGESDEAIGARLELSELTVRSHRLRLQRKLDLDSTAALVTYAARNGFWKPHLESINHPDS